MKDRKKIERQSFGKIKTIVDMPYLLDLQISSFNNFLQLDIPPSKRCDQGLQAVFKGIFPVTDVHNSMSLEFEDYSVGVPKYSVEECIERDMTFAAPLKATLRLDYFEKHGSEVVVKEAIRQQVFLGELPLMTASGTFVINGAERVIVSQLHRSPGVFFGEETHPNGKLLFNARIIPYRGSWVEFSMDINDIMYAHIDRKRKFPATMLLRAFGFSDNESIWRLFYKSHVLPVDKLKKDMVVMENVVEEGTGEVLINICDFLTEESIEKLRELGRKKLEVLDYDRIHNSSVLENTLKKDPTFDDEQALYRIYTLLRPGDPPNIETARNLIERMFFNRRRYNLGDVGRYRLGHRLKSWGDPENPTVLTREDFIAIISYMLGLSVEKEGHYTDDIDHLGNRRVRSVGELLANQFNVGLSRLARTIKERMSLQGDDKKTPHDLVNARTVSTVVASFFGSSQLSQFMDQINPLAEMTHKRRLSALGPGGLTRERAGFEVRDVHHTHYGRVCPIETPEGPNIGLISYLATHARVNEFGFLETPYRKVENKKVTNLIEFLSADIEDKYTIAQANAPLKGDGSFARDIIRARKRADYPQVEPHEVDYMDVSPRQLVGVAASLIPFLEHDDANRALMGSNMQRQAVPLLAPSAPIVGTGMESKVAMDSGAMIISDVSGTVSMVSSDRIVIRKDEGTKNPESVFDTQDVHRVFDLTKFKRSNQDTCVNQRPLVRVGDKVEPGTILADGHATERGDLALGANVLVAFVPWYGYNFEDAIVLSERLAHADTYTSIHIEEFECEVRDTKRGTEELTRELPNVSEDAVNDLDENGVIRVGAEVQPGDILVGKVTPKGETELSPEERLLKAIFGEKAGDVKDASLKVPPGIEGVIIDTHMFSRKERDEKTRKADKEAIEKVKRDYQEKIQHVRELRSDVLTKILYTGKAGSDIVDIDTRATVVETGKTFTKKLLSSLDFDRCRPTGAWAADEDMNRSAEKNLVAAGNEIRLLEDRLDREIEKIQRGDELSPGISKLVKVRVARKRKVQVGDKMAGRHGNKGVVSKVVPVEDMPYLEDGTPVDIVLNPLGVPSRMNLGQILETHLGWAGLKLGKHYASSVFDGASWDEIQAELEKAGLPKTGKTKLYDGRTGQPFDHDVTVGVIYMLKLLHLVADKIHARSIGPYSLVTQQPLGGKAQFGGQRFGEMEVWALEAYGAAHILQEMLTVKSDDVLGRSRIYESIVKGENPPEPGLPESFNVLVKELQSLGLDIQLLKDGEVVG
ncbi:MAG: DNA-directed RNA polymerase subunit beta [Candidatus Latescibacteria bacterium]|nr:DNA-directed RNA polymerase subunit beta [Candidatus Latescibacterota bacterium]